MVVKISKIMGICLLRQRLLDNLANISGQVAHLLEKSGVWKFVQEKCERNLFSTLLTEVYMTCWMESAKNTL